MVTKINGIVLGVGAPNICSDGRRTMCAIILTEAFGLTRIYPINAAEKFGVWSLITMEVERHPKDSRSESYRIGCFEITGRVADSGEKRAMLNACVLRSAEVDPIQYQNELKKSIVLTKLDWGNVSPSLAQRTPSLPRDDDEFSWIQTQGQFWNKPYIVWKSRQGIQHKTHLVGREVYEGLRKNPNRPWDIFNNMQINSPDYESWLLLGNMRNRRNVWVGVHLHRLKKTMPDNAQHQLKIPHKRHVDWPYCKQESLNFNISDRQLSFPVV